MFTFSFRQRKPLGDVWCRQCRRASRFGQWIPGGDVCPHCAAPNTARLPWVLLRLHQPSLPLTPEFGQMYPLGPIREPA